MTHRILQLKNHAYTDLFHAEGIDKLDHDFLNYLQETTPEDYAGLLAYRVDEKTFSPENTSELLIRCAIMLEQFLIHLFQIQTAADIAQIKTNANNPISIFKKYFVLKRAKKEVNHWLVSSINCFDTLTTWLQTQVKQAAIQSDDMELAVSLLGCQYLDKPNDYIKEIDQLVQWCIHALATSEGKRFVAGWKSFQIPERLDYANLVPTRQASAPYASMSPHLRERDGFALTDPRMSAREVQDEIHYCIYCHDHQGDFCSKGFPTKKGDPSQGFKKNPLHLTLTGCPLEEKISEAHFLKKDGYTLASLAMIMIDNPMCPATGHRICNDCMKACIYQKQEPVNIPQIETRILTDVLQLPWGVEIYDLLTRWNPLRAKQWQMKAYNGMNILIAGMGPAGFTLAHHLLLEGFAVVGFDGLKIEPLPNALITHPIYDFNELKESLDERLMAGFGGVAEYGITVRWDKNFLKLIYLSLLRKPYFQVFGSVRFGGTLTVEDAWKMGFDHLAIAVGAGLPKALPIPGSLAPGMRQANDFLMALQLGNAAKKTSLTNLQIRLPAVVIGGGLTGVDTATEVQAYYITQVEKILLRYETLAAEQGEENLLSHFDLTSHEILRDYITHGKAVRAEREQAKQNRRPPKFIKLLHEWGGVTIAYRRSMQESPAYIHNHEELKKALEEGIFYAENLEPASAQLDLNGQVEALICYRRQRLDTGEWINTPETITLPARSILVATGTQPNTAYEFEHKGTFNRINLQYQHYEENEQGSLTVAHGVEHCKDPAFGPFTSYQLQDKRVSLVGDTHPVFHGNVVKAIASGLRTYPKIAALLKPHATSSFSQKDYAAFKMKMENLFYARVQRITRIHPDTLLLEIKAPIAAKHFKAGQFYRLQNYETYSTQLDNTLLQMEPLALLAADHHEDELSFIIKETSTAARLCATLKPGDPVSLMGPTGVRAKIPTANETVLVIGNAASFGFLRSYSKELKTANNRVIYLALLNHVDELFQQSILESNTDAIIWMTRSGPCVIPNRPQDRTLSSEHLLDGLHNYASSNASSALLADVDRIYVIGDTRLLREVQSLRRSHFKEIFLKDPNFYGSVYGNMQCMLKGVCAQCLQWQINPETGLRTKAVFACSWQDQPLEIIDIHHMEERQQQNQTQEILSKLWLASLLKKNLNKKISLV